jgi:hypothetical protein
MVAAQTRSSCPPCAISPKGSGCRCIPLLLSGRPSHGSLRSHYQSFLSSVLATVTDEHKSADEARRCLQAVQNELSLQESSRQPVRAAARRCLADRRLAHRGVWAQAAAVLELVEAQRNIAVRALPEGCLCARAH